MGVVKRFAVVRGGIVENVILARDGFEIPGVTLVDVSELRAGPGWLYDGETFTEPELTEDALEADPDEAPLTADELKTLRSLLRDEDGLARLRG